MTVNEFTPTTEEVRTLVEAVLPNLRERQAGGTENNEWWRRYTVGHLFSPWKETTND